MNTLSLLSHKYRTAQSGVIALMLLMAVTRADHFGSALSLPDASLAVFFLAGLWFGGRVLFLSLLAEAALIDYVAIGHFGVSDYCISPAYVFLVPAYGAAWLAGVLGRAYEAFNFAGLLKLFGLLLIAVSVAFVISNGSFFVLSDKISMHSWDAYMAQWQRYYPSYLMGSMSYCVAIVLVVNLFKQALVENKASNAL